MNVRRIMVFPIKAYYNTKESTNFRHIILVYIQMKLISFINVNSQVEI